MYEYHVFINIIIDIINNYVTIIGVHKVRSQVQQTFFYY